MTIMACEQLSPASAAAEAICGHRGLHALASELLTNTMSRHCARFSIMLEEGAIATSCMRLCLTLSKHTSICSAARIVWRRAGSGFLRLRLPVLLHAGQGGVPLSGRGNAKLLLDC